MRRHVVGMGRRGRDGRIGTRRRKRRLRQNRVIAAMDEIVRDPRMIRLLRENRRQNFYTLALVGESLIRLGRDDIERQRVKNCGFGVIRIGRLKLGHLLFKPLSMLVCGLTILAIDFRQRSDVCALPGRDGGAGCDLRSPCDRSAAGCRIAVLPQPVVMRHGNSPLCHRARGILFRDFLEDCSRLLVLE